MRDYAIELLLSLKRVQRIFVLNDHGTDRLRVAVVDDDLAANDELADVYWNVFDRYPNYDFKIEPIPIEYFDASSLPLGFEEVPVRNVGS